MSLFTRHSDYLERENEELRGQLRDLTSKYHELAMQKLQSPQRQPNQSPIPAGEDRKSATNHLISRDGNKATCKCGWTCINDDPAELQNEIHGHYNKNVVKFAKKTWQHIRNEMEGKAEIEARKQILP